MASPCRFHPEESPTSIAPKYASWDDFLARTKPAAIRAMCHARTKKANANRLMSAAPERRLTAVDVWNLLSAANGRCTHCGSLCLETLPYDGKIKLPWAAVGRRVGSVEHLTSRIEGGGNEAANLAWACLWCNTWPCERRFGATDHGGLYPPGDATGAARQLPTPWTQRTTISYADELADAYGFVEEDDPAGRNWL